MSTELTQAYDTELTDLLPQWADRITQLQETVREQVIFGAHVGALITEGSKKHKADMWDWLKGLHPDIREAHVRIAIKAYHYRERNPELDDVSQLTFALSLGEASPSDNGDGLTRYASGENDVTQQLSVLMKAWAGFNRLQRTPVDKWDSAVRRGFKEQLRPFVELYNKL